MNSSIEIGMDGKRLQVMDYLKGFSIFTISLMHLISRMSAMPSKIVTLSAIGGTGVHVFFLCSATGLYLSYLNHITSFREFVKRRFFKIYIPYIIVIIVSFLLPWMYNGSNRIVALLSHIFLFKMFLPQYEESFGEHFWFISTIIQFYLLFIPMCKLKKKIKNKVTFASIFFCISIIWWIFCYVFGVSDERVWSSFCLQYIWEFALGFVVAELLYEGKKIKVKSWVLLLLTVFGIGLQSGMALFSNDLRLFNDIPALIGYTSLALLLMKITLAKWCGSVLSTFSYEYYLIHILVFNTIFYLVNPRELITQCSIGIAAIVAALVISYFYKQFISKFIFKRNEPSGFNWLR